VRPRGTTHAPASDRPDRTVRVTSLTGCEAVKRSAIEGGRSIEPGKAAGVKTADPFFSGPTAEGTAFEKVTAHIYTAKSGWYRTIVVDTTDGLVVVDPMGPRMVPVLLDGIAKTFPGKKVKTLFYTHYHLDHVAGGATFGATEVIGHEKCPQYWRELAATDIAPITHPISGDQTLIIGGVEIHALYMGHSHTDTLYALHFPTERVLFTADLGLVKTVAPIGTPDSYWPGYLAALGVTTALRTPSIPAPREALPGRDPSPCPRFGWREAQGDRASARASVRRPRGSRPSVQKAHERFFTGTRRRRPTARCWRGR